MESDESTKNTSTCHESSGLYHNAYITNPIDIIPEGVLGSLFA